MQVGKEKTSKVNDGTTGLYGKCRRAKLECRWRENATCLPDLCTGGEGYADWYRNDGNSVAPSSKILEHFTLCHEVADTGSAE
jgi:hypothetical protein